MNKKYLQSFLMAVFLMTTVTVVNADDVHAVDAIERLEHNQRLLTETAIGKNLQQSDNQNVVYLYKQATKLLSEAQAKYNLGQYEKALVASRASVKIIYAADRVMYSLSE